MFVSILVLHRACRTNPGQGTLPLEPNAKAISGEIPSEEVTNRLLNICFLLNKAMK